MSSHPSVLPQRGLNVRQVETVEKLFASARALLDEAAYDDISIRLVATGAGVSAATAYTYFSSKDHLFATLYWRHLADAGRPALSGDPAERLQQTVRHLADTIAGGPMLSAAATKSLLASDPDVERVRRSVGQHWYSLFSEALGDRAEPALLRTLVFTFSGALIEAGVGVIEYADLGRELEASVALIARGNT
ncbi:TetR/AcrR family transcriptional regulator [Nocardioides sp. SR21]|uniref:TetR/AcrR family transcriptional regulator n=1 Tax=Nocardioides sp. SR21 TaxID=2919501 RepID=UPI001FA9611C|nr:TetR/AcrR family transcriptional regulator [Nocardioides sp. SR21]